MAVRFRELEDVLAIHVQERRRERLREASRRRSLRWHRTLAGKQRALGLPPDRSDVAELLRFEAPHGDVCSACVQRVASAHVVRVEALQDVLVRLS